MKPTYIVWHESASSFGTAALVRKWHLNNGWRDIGYHGVILNGYLTAQDVALRRKVEWLDGKFQLGRSFGSDADITGREVGAHAYGFNRDSVGLCLIGEDGKFSAPQMREAFSVTRHWMEQFDITEANVIGHYELGDERPEFSTDKTCPGLDMEKVRGYLKVDRSIDINQNALISYFQEFKI